MLRSLSPDTLAPAILPLRAFRQRRLVEVLDQTRLPRDEGTVSLTSAADAARAIADAGARRAVIGVTAAMDSLSLGTDPSDAGMHDAYDAGGGPPDRGQPALGAERVRATVAPRAHPARPTGTKRTRSPPRTWRPIARSASTVSPSSELAQALAGPRAHALQCRRAGDVGLVPRPRRFIWLSSPAFRFMSG